MENVLLTLFVFISSTPAAFCQNSGKLIGREVYNPSTSSKAIEYYNTGSTQMEAKNYGKAIENLRLAIACDSNFTDAYDNLGLAFRQINELDSAEHYYVQSIKKYPKGLAAHLNLAIVQERKGNIKRAIELNKIGTTLEPTDPESYFALCREYSMLKMYQDALDNGKQAEKYYSEKKSPYIGDCYYMLCVIYSSMDNKASARKYMAMAQDAGVKIDPKVSDMLK